MKQLFKKYAPIALGIATALAATPAFAQDYTYEAEGEAAGFLVLCCWGLAGLLGLAFLVFWVWMFIDLIGRNEYEFPAGQSKTTWLLIMLLTWVVGFNWLAAIFYYFMVYKKVKRGSAQPPASGGGYQPPASGGGYQPPAPPQAPPPPPPPSAPPAPPQAPPAPPSDE